MKTLISQLKKEHYKHRNDDRLQEIYSNLEQLLGSAEIVLRDTPYSQEMQGLSYLDVRESLTSHFSKLLNNSFDGLLDFIPIQTGYINGSLLVVPVAGRAVEEKYRIQLGQDISTFDNGKLLYQLDEIRCSPNTPENLRSAINEAMDLVNLLEEKPYKTQRLEQDSKYEDFY